MESVTRVQILDEAVCISLCANSLEKSMNPCVFSPAISKYQGTWDSSALVRQQVWKKENSKFKPAVLYLKIDLVSHPTCIKRVWVNIHKSEI